MHNAGLFVAVSIMHVVTTIKHLNIGQCHPYGSLVQGTTEGHHFLFSE